ncbi:hypothetical protein D9623_20645 [Azospirillum brasilense]|uniref:Uncharacterized protein n=1 Tax=Azospirillum brasilense TaxID=192 RepID=A0A4D8QLH4_AZOBR|nr:hypothetical protein D3868_14150 [Azospirillum brasilense]QEL92455.1 hypothetical protein D9621_20335 [Azospirillum brasilense]QEL98772.1 hypothetical protein D9623_20645 [Azospirillum brasilense]
MCTWCAPEIFVQNWKVRISNGFDYHVCTVWCTRKGTPTNPKTRTKPVGWVGWGARSLTLLRQSCCRSTA